MPVLKNSKWERFCQAIAKGKSQSEAYEIAGYKGDRTAASRLATKVNIKARVAELMQRTAEKAAVTADSLMAEADELMRAAKEAKQFGPAVAALKEKGVLSGKRIERREQGEAGEFDAIEDINELRQQLITKAKELGFGDIAATLAAGEGEAGKARRTH